MTVGEALRAATARLAEAGVASAPLEARLLLAHAMGLDQSALLRDRTAPAPVSFLHLVERRATHEPVAHIVGRQGFWTLDLEVSAATLIPRADSETLIEAAVAARPGRHAVQRVLDLGTGTGCLLLAALAEFPAAWGAGLDRSAAAVALAVRNALLNGLERRAAFAVADWAAPVEATFDLVLSNPPYIRSADIDGLMPDVGRFEPRSALDGGTDGLGAYRALLSMLPRLLAPGGVAVFELGIGQAAAVTSMAGAAGFSASLRADLGGVARALVLEKTLGIPCPPQ